MEATKEMTQGLPVFLLIQVTGDGPFKPATGGVDYVLQVDGPERADGN